MSTGRVIWFNKHRGYGFIRNSEARDVFVHYSAIAGEGRRILKRGQKVNFEQLNTNEGLKAASVCLLS